ncbi:MAG: hypothetical protein H0V19_03390 [Euzebyales bacterium]|nr:hypothetical protein [Euzebyales bacterium]
MAGAPPTVWVLTDRRYLGQRMPAALVGALRDGGVAVRVVSADRLVSEVGRGDPAFAPGGEDLVVARTRSPFALSLLCEAERAGIACVNSWSAVDAVRDKPRTALTLAAAGIPTPRTFLADHPRSLVTVPAACFPLLLKPHLGDNAKGIVMVDRPEGLAGLGWNDGMVLAQQYVDVARVDLKLYGAGDAVWAVRRPSPLAPAGEWCQPVTVTAALGALAHGCRSATGLELYGVDVLPSAEGPLVVDVNDFPNYTGVGEAPADIAALLRERVAPAVAA